MRAVTAASERGALPVVVSSIRSAVSGLVLPSVGREFSLWARKREKHHQRPARTRGCPMSVRATTATARRVLSQLHGDPRTIALLLLVPCLLMTQLHSVFAGQPDTFDRVGLQLL